MGKYPEGCCTMKTNLNVGDLVYCNRDPFETTKHIGVIIAIDTDSDGVISYLWVRFMDGSEDLYHPTGVELLPKT